MGTNVLRGLVVAHDIDNQRIGFVPKAGVTLTKTTATPVDTSSTKKDTPSGASFIYMSSLSLILVLIAMF